MDLSKLAPPKGARKVRTRVGLGESSGLGKTCGRGGKGQTARAGGSIRPGFEGGQMPLYRRLPKVGFVSRKKVLGLNVHDVVNLSVLDKLAEGTTVTPELLYSMGYGRRASSRAGLKVLGSGNITKKLNLKVNAISSSAKEKIESLGGTVEIVPA